MSEWRCLENGTLAQVPCCTACVPANERGGGGPAETKAILDNMRSATVLSDAEQDALIEWLNSASRVKKAMSAGVLGDLYRVVASIAERRALRPIATCPSEDRCAGTYCPSCGCCEHKAEPCVGGCRDAFCACGWSA